MIQEPDREFEQYLEGGSDLSDAYASLPGAEPPEYLDYAIRAEAHSVTGERARRARARNRDPLRGWATWQKWTMPLSVVAMLVVVVLVGLELPYMPKPEQAAPAAGERDKTAAAPPAAKPEPATRSASPGTATADRARAAATMAPAAKQGAPAARLKAPAEQKPEAPVVRQAPAPETPVAPAPAMEVAPAGMAAPAPLRDRVAAQPDAARWLARIAQLKREGKRDEAKKELAEFRKRYPDYPVPEDLHDLR